jgi:hypothetical protein
MLTRRNGQVQSLSSGRIATTITSPRSGSFPDPASPGQFCTIIGGAGQPDITYQYVMQSTGTYAWVEVIRAI